MEMTVTRNYTFHYQTVVLHTFMSKRIHIYATLSKAYPFRKLQVAAILESIVHRIQIIFTKVKIKYRKLRFSQCFADH